MSRKKRKRLRNDQQGKQSRSSSSGYQDRADTQGASEAESQTKPSRPPLSRYKLWLFRLTALVGVPLLGLVLLEGGVRFVGGGYPTGAMLKQELDGQVFYSDNPQFGWRFFPRAIARDLAPFVIPSDKPPNTYRIFVLGGSAAQGVPDAAYGFSRVLQVMLRNAYPGVDFEVVNMAMTAINSHVVYHIARDCADHEPDLFIVYLGNNEVVGPYGVGTVFTGFASNTTVSRLGVHLKQSRAAQLVSAIFEGQDQTLVGWRGMEMFLEKQIRQDDPRLQDVYHNFEKNLHDIARIAQECGARIIFSTVGSNLKDSSPFASLNRPDIAVADRTRCEQLITEGIELQGTGELDTAIERYQVAAKIDPTYAELQFRLGMCYEARGEFDLARECYVKAREFDTLRFRADRRINDIIQGVAQAKAEAGIYFVDAAEDLAANSPHGIPGEELFYEHVHLKFAGNYRLAGSIFEQVREILPESIQAQAADERPPLTLQQCALQLAYTDFDKHQMMKEIVNSYFIKPPFTNQVANERRVNQAVEQLTASRAALTPEVLERCAAQYRRAIDGAGDDPQLRFKYGQLLTKALKDPQSAVQQYRKLTQLLPFSTVGYVSLGNGLAELDDTAGAIASYQQAIRLNPMRYLSHWQLAQAFEELDRLDEAEQQYELVTQLVPTFEAGYNRLSKLLLEQQRFEEAAEICRRGLRYVPNSEQLRINLKSAEAVTDE